MIDLSICIVNTNQRELLCSGLTALQEAPPRLRVEIIVVDNASTDGSVEMLHQSFRHVQVIAAPDNLGYARALNRAFALARGRYLLALNEDTRVLPGACETLVEFAERHADAGLIGPRLLNPDGTPQRSGWQGFPSLRSALIEALYLWRIAPWLPWVRRSEAVADDSCELHAVDHVLGAAMMVRAEIVRTLGGMQEGFFLFLDETEWCLRIKRAGWRIYVVPGARIVHIGQQSVHVAPERTMPQLYRNLVLFHREHCGRCSLYLAVLKAIIAVACLLRIGLWTHRARDLARHPRALRMRRGYRRVLRELWSY
jgi:N-acetylglucosaminyl-diphospho-decaprenol L-rhamnosyltransferase